MAVEDHPVYEIWKSAFDHRNEAERRYREAQVRKDVALTTYRRDYDEAQAAYDVICDELGKFDHT